MDRHSETPGSWLRLEQQFEDGDAAFVEEIRRIHDAEKLGRFASKWMADHRASSRTLLLAYLDLPLNTYRHEALVKRLFKLAEKAGDDIVMGAFFVAMDRSVARAKMVRTRYEWTTRTVVSHSVIIIPRGTTLSKKERRFPFYLPIRKVAKEEGQRLFSVVTRHYLRRRAWRYFRNIAKADAPRYIRAMLELLFRYTELDAVDGLAMIDKSGLMRILFGKSDVIEFSGRHWGLRDGKTLAELKPAPPFLESWISSPTTLLQLLKRARCIVVRQWCIEMIQSHAPQALDALSLEELLQLLEEEEPAVAALAFGSIRRHPQLQSLSVKHWISILQRTSHGNLADLIEIFRDSKDVTTIEFLDAIMLAKCPPYPLAHLGTTVLETKSCDSAEVCAAWLSLANANCETIRPQLVELIRRKVGPTSWFDSHTVLALMDSKFSDVRDKAWEWFAAEPRIANDYALWGKILETPYDDIKVRMLIHLQKYEPAHVRVERHEHVTPGLLRSLWAATLLNTQRSSRYKPMALSQIVQRLESHRDEWDEWFPLLCVSIRSSRVAEWRTGMVGLVRLLRDRPELRERVQKEFPQLSFES
jgi:hypothetical protein